ncbi:MAG: glycosyltransferase [Bacteroidales bacterium]|nr:glycosyltransferase [Bacteroidales bacterium]
MIHILHIIQSPDNPDWELLKNLSGEETKSVILQTSGGQPDTFEPGALPSIASEQVTSSAFQLIHAHSWMLDGVVAWRLNQQHGIPYIVSLSEDDIEYVGRMSLKFHSDRLRILQDAAKLIFPHPQFYEAFNQAISSSQADQLFSKTSTLFRPLDSLFHDNASQHKPVALVRPRLLYFAEGASFKDDTSLILKAMKEIRQMNLSISLSIVTLAGQEALASQAASVASSSTDVKHLACPDHASILTALREHDIVVMPGTEIRQTCHFAAAITQGLPVIHSQHSCVDGVLTELNNYRLEKESASQLKEIILKISQQYATIEQRVAALQPLHKFKFEEISSELLRIYTICNNLQHRNERFC